MITLNNWKKLASAFVFAVSAGVLGLLFFYPDVASIPFALMKANVAFCLCLSSAASLVDIYDGSKKYHWAVKVLAGTALLISALTMVEYLFAIDLGLGELLTTDRRMVPGQIFPGRMSPVTVLCFLSLFTAQLFPRFSNILIIPVTVCTFLFLTGFIYGISTSLRWGANIQISWISAICLLAMASVNILTNPLNDIVRFLVKSTPASVLTRRLLLAGVCLPLIGGWLRLTVSKANLLSPPEATALFVVFLIFVFSTIILKSGLTLEVSWQERVTAEKALQDAVNTRDDFMSVASHELKTPLTSLKIQNQIFQKLLQKEIVEVASLQKYSGHIDRQVTRVARLVDSMMDLTRIRSGQIALNPELIDICALIEDVAYRFRDEVQMTGDLNVEVHVCDPVVGMWDALKIEQVALNLLSNAVRYGDGKPITIDVDSSEGKVTISVTDQGRGISAEDQQKIFKRFERAVHHNYVSGLGLGLYITKQIVELHRGQIEVTSVPGKGSTFTVTLPV